nr:hypothetical protein [Cloning vector pSOK804]
MYGRRLLLVGLVQRAHLDQLGTLLLLGETTEQGEQAFLGVLVERARRGPAGRGENALFGELRVRLMEGAKLGLQVDSRGSAAARDIEFVIMS